MYIHVQYMHTTVLTRTCTFYFVLGTHIHAELPSFFVRVQVGSLNHVYHLLRVIYTCLTFTVYCNEFRWHCHHNDVILTGYLRDSNTPYMYKNVPEAYVSSLVITVRCHVSVWGTLIDMSNSFIGREMV